MKKYNVDHIWHYEELGLSSPVLHIGEEIIKPKKFVVEHDTYRKIYHHAYHYKSLVLCLSGSHNFIIYEVTTKKAIALSDTFTASFEKVLEGFHLIANYCPDWNLLADEIKNDQAKATAMVNFLINTYEEYFGAYWDYAIFGRKFAQDMGNAVRASKALSRSAL